MAVTGVSAGEEIASTTFIFERDESRRGRCASYLSYVIRRVEALDASDVCAVENACFNDPYPSAVLNDLINRQQDRFFVALYHEKIVGYAVASANAMEGHVISVAVDPRYRRRSIGTALLSAVSTKLVEEGIKQIRLEVRKGNAGAIAFYDQMGYRTFSEIRHYYADGEDALLLARSAESCPPFDNRVESH